METIEEKMRAVARQALASGEVDVIIGWEAGDLWHDAPPVFVTDPEKTGRLVWNPFCVSNLSKYLPEELKHGRKAGVFLKGCDARALNQLVQDRRVERERVKVYGLPCPGMLDPEKLRQDGLNRGLSSVTRRGEQLIFRTAQGEEARIDRRWDLDKCRQCRYPNPVTWDEMLGEVRNEAAPSAERFAEVERLEALGAEERAEYWEEQFSRCTRCHACRNVCPACSCATCIFDNPASAAASKARIASEAAFYHITRAYHVAGRCVDCGECSRVCPAGVPLQSIQRKIIKDIGELYGGHEAGTDAAGDAPLGVYRLDDADPFDGHRKGGKP